MAPHREVHNHDVRLDLPCQDRGLFAVSDLTHDLQVGLGIQQHRQAGAQHRMVVRQEYANRRHVPSLSGICT